MKDADFMRQALLLAAEDTEEVPVGAVIVCGGKVIAGAHNEQLSAGDALAHAELLAISRARKALGKPRLEGCTLYVTLEPCPMCAGALVMSGLERCVYAAFDTQYGCCGSVYALPMDPVFHHFVQCEGGLLEDESKSLMNRFFGRLRAEKKPESPQGK